MGRIFRQFFFVGFDITNPWIQDHFPEYNSHINFLATIAALLWLIQGLPLQHQDLMPSVSKFSTPCYILRKVEYVTSILIAVKNFRWCHHAVCWCFLTTSSSTYRGRKVQLAQTFFLLVKDLKVVLISYLCGTRNKVDDKNEKPKEVLRHWVSLGKGKYVSDLGILQLV